MSVNCKVYKPIPPATTHMYPVGENVKCVQKALNAKTTFSPKLLVDGAYGPLTQQRVRDFQYSRGLVADGQAGQITLTALGIWGGGGGGTPPEIK